LDDSGAVEIIRELVPGYLPRQIEAPIEPERLVANA
jgi:hypothetical protein